jgi:hypothetical protein
MMIRARVSALVLSLILLVASAAAAADTPGVTAYKNKQWPLAFSKLAAEAQMGNLSSMYYLGNCYYFGRGVRKQNKLAALWWRRAAAKGHLKGMYSIGLASRRGYGVVKDPAQALVWFKRCAQRGHANAMYAIGNMYYHGELGPKDHRQAFDWFKTAAARGHSRAMNDLGVMYYRGEGRPKDLVRAYFWFSLGAAMKNQKAIKNLEVTGAKLSPAQKEQAESLLSAARSAGEANGEAANGNPARISDPVNVAPIAQAKTGGPGNKKVSTANCFPKLDAALLKCRNLCATRFKNSRSGLKSCRSGCKDARGRFKRLWVSFRPDPRSPVSPCQQIMRRYRMISSDMAAKWRRGGMSEKGINNRTYGLKSYGLGVEMIHQ